MRAIAVNEWGGRERMELLDVEPPPVAPDGVLVRVRAAGLNPVDYKVREGKLADKFPFHFPVVLGWDVAGTVEAVGPAVTWFKPGDAVYGYNRRHDLGFGTYAELTTRSRGLLRAHAARADLRGGRRAAAGRADRPPGDRALGPAGWRDVLRAGRLGRGRAPRDPARASSAARA